MKLKDGFVLRQIGSENVVLPVDGDAEMEMMISLNDTGAFLWEKLQQQTDREALIAALLGEYEVDRDTAAAAVDAFVRQVEGHGFLA